MSEVSPGHRPKRSRGTSRKSSKKGPLRKKPTDPTTTGRVLRQQFSTPTVQDLRGRISTLATAGPMNGPNATGTDDHHPIYTEFVTKFSDRDMAAVFDAVRASGVVEFLDARIQACKSKPGRPAALTYRALIVALLLTAIDGKGCLASEVAKTLYRRLYPPSMHLLGIDPLPAPRDSKEERRQRWKIEKRTRDALHRLLAVLDPSIHPKGTSMPWVELRGLDRDLTPEEIEDRQTALAIVCNTILQTPYNLLPAKVKRKYRGSVCMDGTPLRVYSRGYSVDSATASADPDAAFGARSGDHAEGNDLSISKSWFGFEINLAVAVCDWLGPRQFMPALPYVMHLDRPGVDPAGAARWMVAFLEEGHHEPRYLAGDGLYALADPDKFHIPAREAGWRLVMPVPDGHLGIQASMQGLLLIEGHWYCPSIPQILINATRDFRAGEFDLEVYRLRINEREKYRARFKGTNTSGTQRWGCAASGSHPSVICALKPKSEQHKFIGGPVLGVRLKDRVLPDPATQTTGIWPKACRQDSVSIDLTTPGGEDDNMRNAARFSQDLIFGTAEHTDTYNALRQSQEGLHGFVKDDAYEALGTPGKRRIRGLAAQSLFAAVLLAAAGIRKVRVFLRNALTDENGDLYIPRRKRKGEHASTHLPPGGPGTRGDPDSDESSTDQGAA